MLLCLLLHCELYLRMLLVHVLLEGFNRDGLVWPQNKRVVNIAAVQFGFVSCCHKGLLFQISYVEFCNYWGDAFSHCTPIGLTPVFVGCCLYVGVVQDKFQ